MRLKQERNARDNRLLALIPTVPASYMGIHSAMMNMFRTLGFALGPTLASMAWSQKPHLDVKDMRMTVCVLLAVQVLTLLSVTGYKGMKKKRVGENAGQEAP